jgi:hypothetical protein
MFGFRSERSAKLAREKAYNEQIFIRHNANMKAEKAVPPQSDQPPSRKKAGFGKRTIYPW